MRAFVFTDKSLERQAGRFVWLAMNSEKAVNAPLRSKFPVAALPTYLIVDPVDEKIALRWVGGASIAQLHALLDNGVAAVERKRGASGLDALLARADSLYGAQADSSAAVAYGEVLAAAPADWKERARVVDALAFSLSMAGDRAALLALAAAELPRYRGTPTGVGLAAFGLDAVTGLSEEDSTRGRAIAEYEAALSEALADPRLEVSADDRSSYLGVLVEARKAVRDSAGARRQAERWAAFLEEAAAGARTPEQRTVFDSHRLSAYLELGKPELAVAMLEQSERELPDDYNPPARLALAYQRMERWDEALAAADRALARVYGPRKLRVLTLRADVLAARGDAAGARRTIEEAVAFAEALPPGQRSERTIAALRKRLETMAATH